MAQSALGAADSGTAPTRAVRAYMDASSAKTTAWRRGANQTALGGASSAASSRAFAAHTTRRGAGWVRGASSPPASARRTCRQRCARCQAAAARGDQGASTSTWTLTATGDGILGWWKWDFTSPCLRPGSSDFLPQHLGDWSLRRAPLQPHA